MSQVCHDRSPLLGKTLPANLNLPHKHITTLFAVACIIDQFGVNPIVVLPKGIILCGWVGYPLALFVFSLTVYTAMLLGKCWVIAEQLDSSMILKSRYAYTALTEMAWGKNVAKIINIIINVSVFSSNIPALLIASQNLQFFDARISNFTFNFSYCYWLIILGVALCPLTWLGSPKDTKWISVISAISVIVCAFLTWLCMVSDTTRSSVYVPVPAPNWQGVSVAFGILTFQFGCHPAILTIQTDMYNKMELSRSILLSFLVTGGLSFVTIWLSALLYGSGTHANLTQGLPVDFLLYFNILIVTLQLFLSTIVGQCTLFQDVEDKLGISRELCWQRCVSRSIIVGFVIVFAEVLPRFDLVMGIVGGLLTGPITLIFPPLLHLQFRKLLHHEKHQNKIEKNVSKSGDLAWENDFRPKLDCPSEETTFVQIKSKFSIRSLKTQKFIKDFIDYLTPDMNLSETNVSTTETVISFFIVGFGILQTIAATYYSTKGAIDSTKFLPPCIVDVDVASGIINS